MKNLKKQNSKIGKFAICCLLLAAALLIPSAWAQEEEGGFMFGDINQDGQVDLLDTSPFETLLLNDCQFVSEADFDQDGEVNLLDYAEFVKLLGGGQ